MRTPQFFKLLIFLCAIHVVQDVIGQTIKFDWVSHVYSDSPTRVEDIIQDKLGNYIAVGSVSDTFEIKPVTGAGYQSVSQRNDGFLAKYTESGQLVFAFSIGGPFNDACYHVSVNDSGEIYASGRVSGPVDFDPDTSSYIVQATGGGYGQYFIAKYSSSGKFQWVKLLISGQDNISDLALDGSNNIYLSGDFRGTEDFDPGPGVQTYSSTWIYSDAFVLKLNPDGSYNDTYVLTGKRDERVSSIEVRGADLWVVGDYGDTTDFNHGIGVNTLIPTNIENGFVVKMDTSFSFSFAKKIGGVKTHDVELDINGNVLISGIIADSLTDFDPSNSAVFSIKPSWWYFKDAFILKLDSSGNFVWAKSHHRKQINTYANYHSHLLKIYLDSDSSGNIYSSSDFVDVIDIDPDTQAVHLLNGMGYALKNSYILMLDDSGKYITSTMISALTQPSGFLVDRNDELLFAGQFWYWQDVDPGPDSTILRSKRWNGYLSHLKYCVTTSQVDTMVGCDSIHWIDGNVYSQDTLGAIATLLDSRGCDSIHILDLVIKNSSFRFDSIFSCSSYTWINGQRYTSSNTTDTVVFTNSQGCDSVITLDLTIPPLPDTSISVINRTIFSNASQPVAYQWLECLGGSVYQVLTGDTADSLNISPKTIGCFAVEVSSNGCFDTTKCICFNSSVGIDLISKKELVIHPNPTSGELSIDLQELENPSVFVFNPVGRRIDSQCDSKGSCILPEKCGPGVYLIVIKHQRGVETARVVKTQ